MFLQASVILLTGGEYLTRYIPGTRYTPGPGTPPRPGTPPQTRYTPRDQVHSPPPDQVHPPGPGTLPPGPGTPPTRYTPPDQVPPRDQVHPPPRGRTCWEIRSTRGRYASYWNAILFYSVVCDVNVINSIRIL